MKANAHILWQTTNSLSWYGSAGTQQQQTTQCRLDLGLPAVGHTVIVRTYWQLCQIWAGLARVCNYWASEKKKSQQTTP